MKKFLPIFLSTILIAGSIFYSVQARNIEDLIIDDSSQFSVNLETSEILLNGKAIPKNILLDGLFETFEVNIETGEIFYKLAEPDNDDVIKDIKVNESIINNFQNENFTRFVATSSSTLQDSNKRSRVWSLTDTLIDSITAENNSYYESSFAGSSISKNPSGTKSQSQTAYVDAQLSYTIKRVDGYHIYQNTGDSSIYENTSAKQ